MIDKTQRTFCCFRCLIDKQVQFLTRPFKSSKLSLVQLLRFQKVIMKTKSIACAGLLLAVLIFAIEGHAQSNPIQSQ